MLPSIALRRLRLLALPKGAGLDAKRKLVLLAELAKLGIRVENPELLDEASEEFLLDYPRLIEELRAYRGGDVEYVPLHLGFPASLPDDEYFAKRIIGYLGNCFSVFSESDGEVLEDGRVIPRWLFALEDFGANPVTQMQDASLWERATKRLRSRKDDTHVEWFDFELAHEGEVLSRLRAWLRDCLMAKSSIREALHADVSCLLQTLGCDGLDLTAIPLKENQALVLKLLWEAGDHEAACALARTPTDLLRLFAALTGGDVSLAQPIRFPAMTRAQRRAVLTCLEAAPALAEDLHRYRRLWLAIARQLHVHEYKKRFAKTAAAFTLLREDKVATFASLTEGYLRFGDQKQLLAHLQVRPGAFARRLHEVLRAFPDHSESVLRAFAAVAVEVPVKTLLVLQSYFASINEEEDRVIINKRGAIKVIENQSLGALSASVVLQVQRVVEEALHDALAQKPSLQSHKVWVDPALRSYAVPLAQRAASDGVLTYGRGSRIPLDFGSRGLDTVLRLFVYWKERGQRTDLDLSVIQFDEQWDYQGHVSYTALSGQGIVHSGDVQSAPQGAAEFIDITLKALPSHARYLAVQVYRYTGAAFADLDCHAGWMIRKEVNADRKSFDIKTVQNKFDLQGNAAYCIPLVVDLERQEIVLTDLYVGTRALHNRVEGAYGTVAKASRAICAFERTRPNMHALATAHVQARGATASSREEADLVFAVDGGDYNAGDTEKVLADLL